jgi:hypothetical protein
LRQTPYTPAGFDPTTHISAGGNATAKPRCLGYPCPFLTLFAKLKAFFADLAIFLSIFDVKLNF